MIPPAAPARPGLVALLSGGADSAVMAGLALERGDAVWPLYVRQGFVWEEDELAAVRRFLAEMAAAHPGLVQPLLVSVCLAPRSANLAWAQESAIAPPDLDSPDEAVYIPGRNLALLGQAALAAAAHGLGRVALGILGANPFPDATKEFFRAFERAAGLALAPSFPPDGLRVETPLAAMTKEEVLRLGAAMPLRHTISCLRPSEGAHCGRCNKCAERRAAFQRAGVPDPSRYAAGV